MCVYTYAHANICREAAGNNTHIRVMEPIVYQWLLMLGRLRLWWRSFDTPTQLTGINNLGNTCFFSSTCQALAQCVPLSHALASASGSVPSIQEGLASLLAEYHNDGKQTGPEFHHLDPSKFFRALKGHGLFCQYREDSMEDANTLLLDILCGLQDGLADRLFGFKTKVFNEIT